MINVILDIYPYAYFQNGTSHQIKEATEFPAALRLFKYDLGLSAIKNKFNNKINKKDE